MYRLFILKSIKLLSEDGVFSEIFPLSFTADLSAASLRRYVLKNNTIDFIEAFPERDDEKRRVFEAAKMSVCITRLRKSRTNCNKFFMRIHRDKFVDVKNHKVFLDYKVLSLIDPENLTIPLMAQEDVNIISKIYKKSNRFADIAHCYTGEVDLTLGKKYLTDNEKNDILIKGAIIDRYLIRTEMSQGEIKFLDSKQYLAENKGGKASHHKLCRIVMQGITGVNENPRLKMAIIEPSIFCGNSANYMIFNNPNEDVECYLGILNSKLLNYIFSKFSTNSNVNGYEVDNLPIPKIIEKSKMKKLSSLVREALKKKANDPNADILNIEMYINKMIYELYGLLKPEIAIVENENEKNS